MEGEVPVGLALPRGLAWAKSVPLARPRAAPVGLAWAVVGGIVFVVYLPAFSHAFNVWRLDPTLSFGFFGPPGAAALLLIRRRELATALGAGNWVGLLVLMAGLVLLVAGYISGVHAVSGLSLLPTCVGAAAYVAGFRFARVLGLPLVLLTSSISVYLGLLNSLGFWLQQVTAAGAASMAGVLGTHVVRSGVDLFVGNTHFVVAEACSGMNSLLALLYLGLIVASFVTPSWPVRLLLLASAVPIVLATNITRVTIVLVTSGALGSNLETGFPHAILSAGMFLCAGLLFVLLALGVGRMAWLRAS